MNVSERLASNSHLLDEARRAALKRVLREHGKADTGYHNQRLIEDVATAVQASVTSAVNDILS